jgi:chromosomal replication initiation ATPase DnaA
LISQHQTAHKSQSNTQPTVVLSVDKVLQEIAHVYGISLAEIMSDSRKQ